jgi:hypothetical protein
MLDDAAFYAVNSLVTDRFLLTTQFNLLFTKPLGAGPVIAEGRWVSGQRRVFVAEARLIDATGEEAARGTGTFMRSRIPLSSLPGYRSRDDAPAGYQAVLVSALIRRAEGAGGGAMVLAKGDATAGAILLLLYEKTGQSALRGTRPRAQRKPCSDPSRTPRIADERRSPPIGEGAETRDSGFVGGRTGHRGCGTVRR